MYLLNTISFQFIHPPLIRPKRRASKLGLLDMRTTCYHNLYRQNKDTEAQSVLPLTAGPAR